MDSGVARAFSKLLRNAWAGLGVPFSGGGGIGNVWIDVERLMLMTSWHPGDQRLFTEAHAWVEANSAFVAWNRLAKLGVDWPLDDVRPRERGAQRILAMPGQVQIRFRALLGVTVKAEVLGVLATANRPMTTAQLAEEAMATKRAVDLVLASLRVAEIVASTDEPVARHFVTEAGMSSLENLVASPAQRALGIEPPAYIPWSALTSVVRALLDFAEQMADAAPALRDLYVTEARKRIEPRSATLGLTGLVSSIDRAEPAWQVRNALELLSHLELAGQRPKRGAGRAAALLRARQPGTRNSK